jgi:ferredoxin
MAVRLSVNPIGCDGHGLCAELLPELVSLDDWGFPMVVDEDIPPQLMAAAKRAAHLCPKVALALRVSDARAQEKPR